MTRNVSLMFIARDVWDIVSADLHFQRSEEVKFRRVKTAQRKKEEGETLNDPERREE